MTFFMLRVVRGARRFVAGVLGTVASVTPYRISHPLSRLALWIGWGRM